MYRKNEEYTLTVADLGSDGAGFGRLGELAVFVEGALPGEVVRIKLIKVCRDHAYGKLLEVISPSAARTQPACPVYGRCGGCTLQHMSYGQELAFKRKKVESCLRKIGGFRDIAVPPVIGCDSPYYYRNKAQFPFAASGGAARAGFYSPRSHAHVPVTACRIQHPVMETVLNAVQDFANEYHIPAYNEAAHTGVLRHAVIRVGVRSGQVMACVVVNGSSPPHADALARRLRGIPGMSSICLNFNSERTNVVLGGRTETVWGAPYITDTLCGLEFRISPHSFYQVNPAQTEKLYAHAIESAAIGPDDAVADIYCGIGAISLYAARRARKVYGVEIVPQAIDDARVNARANGITNAEFICGAAETELPRLFAGADKPDAVILDPPRKGCAPGLIQTLLAAPPRKIAYISCDPATLARDLKLLCAAAYEPASVQPFDCFPRTSHVETAVTLRRRDT